MPHEPAPRPRPYAWRNLLHPATETLHMLGILGCLYLALINWRVLAPPAWFGMQGYPPPSPGWLISAWLAFAVLEYPLYFWIANLRATATGPERGYAEPQRRRAAHLTRLGGALGALTFVFISYCILLGITQPEPGFDWRQRWPAAPPADAAR